MARTSADSTTLRYYQSSDSTITTGDTEVGTDSVFRLDASESGDEWISLTAPSAPGTYYYGACVEAVSGESDTTNNCSPAVTVTVGAAPAPDLGGGHADGERERSGIWRSIHPERHVAQPGQWTFGLDHAALLPVIGLDYQHWRHGDRHGLGIQDLDASQSGDESISLTAPSTSRRLLLRGLRGRGIR